MRPAPTSEPAQHRDGVYRRVSAVMGREDVRFMSPDLQWQAIERARSVAGPSLLVADEIDLDVSGGSMDRPGLNRLFDLARKGEISRLWVYDLSRWARITTEGLAELERIEAAGCRVMSTTEQVDLASPLGYFNATLFLAMHKLRRDQIGETWARVAHHRVAERGLWHGPAPLGYRVVKGRGLVRDDLADEVVRVFERYADGEVFSRVVADFNRRRGVRVVQQGSVRRMLSNPVYVGRVRFKGKEYPGAHQPLLGEALWQQVQDRLERDARAPSRRLAGAYTLTGLVFCAACGGPLNHHNYGGRAGVRLDCRNWVRREVCERGAGKTSAVAVEGYVRDWMADRVARLQMDASARAEHGRLLAKAANAAGRLRRELSAARAARGRLAVDRARGVIRSERAYLLADAEMEAEEDRLVALLGDAQEVAGVRSAREAVTGMQWLLDRWGDMLPSERNRALRRVVERVEVRRPAVWREPVESRVRVVRRGDG